MLTPKSIIYSILVCFTIYEFVIFRKQSKPFPVMEIVAAQTTFLIRSVFIKLLFLAGYQSLLQWLYVYRLYTIQPINWGGIILVFLIVDFVYYWHHRLSHTIRFFWTAHCIHHLPKRLMVLSSFQQSISGVFLNLFIFLCIPLVLLGFEPILLSQVVGLNLLYQTWIHNEVVHRLGFFEYFLNTPAQHRIHHSILDAHRNKNFGGILCVFDHLFGTYHMDHVEIKEYGTTLGLSVKNPLAPLYFEFQLWMQLVDDFLRSKGVRNKLCTLIKVVD